MSRERQKNNKLRAEIVDFVKAFWLNHKYAPSHRDIMEATGISSTSVVNYHIGVLVDEGILEHDPVVARSLRPKSLVIAIY